jgi:hypothetical protein
MPVKRKRRGASDLEVTERTAIPALQQAALTDEEIVQEYLAGVVAAASLEEDNAHLLALVSRLTPLQLRLHYELYLGAITCIRSIVLDEGWEGRKDLRPSLLYREIEYVSVSQDFVARLSDDETYQADMGLRIMPALQHLQREQVLSLARGGKFYIEGEEFMVPFTMTSYGMTLFASALGFGSGSLSVADLIAAKETRLQLEPPIPPVTTRILPKSSPANAPFFDELLRASVVPDGTDAKSVFQTLIGNPRSGTAKVESNEADDY